MTHQSCGPICAARSFDVLLLMRYLMHGRRQAKPQWLVSTLAEADEHTVLGISTFFLHFGEKTLFYA